MANGETEERNAFNYCVSFIDLLGQRNAAKGQGLLPSITSEAEDEAFQKILRDNIGGILQLQRDVEEMEMILLPDPNSPLRESLSDEERIKWDELQRKAVNTQFWSDGFVKYACLGHPEIKCVVNGVFEIFCTAGYFCLLGLVRHRPVRGGVDIAWGAEIRPGELYGPAVIRAYELESEVAQYPRIVIGHEVVRFLEAHRNNSGDDAAIRANQEYARHCLDMLAQDDDGYWILHYLGDTFQQTVTHTHHNTLHQKARTFVVQQIEEHKRLRSSKLAFRYAQLLAYFDVYRPSA